MIRFECDYATGAHPKVLQKVVDTNFEECPGYGVDAHCDHARAMLKELCQAPDAHVHFLVGGTQTNMTVIAATLRPHQGVISAVSGHVNGHESGAIESTGHKVLTLPTEDGKINGSQIDEMCRAHFEDPSVEHLVQPGMVYISHPTEMGTLYTLKELEDIRAAADKWHLPVFIDGARLVYGLAAGEVTLADLARLSDAFYLGGTKAGLLMGEAVVLTNEAINKDFRYFIKQKGGMLAKGRLLGAQYEALLEDGLYKEIGSKAVAQALRIRAAFEKKGFPLRFDSPTNQQFPILPNEILAKLNEKYTCCFWEHVDENHTAVRYCTTWSTRDEDVDALIHDIEAL